MDYKICTYKIIKYLLITSRYLTKESIKSKNKTT